MNSTHLTIPCLDRYRTIIRAMLPAGFENLSPPPYQQIASKVTGGKAVAMPESISALNGLPLIRAVWSDVGRLVPKASVVPESLKRLIAFQASDGRLLPATHEDHPESVWYFELQLAHAFATAGLLLNDKGCLNAAQRAATYILNEVQPDHASNRPWGITAFMLSQSTLPLVDWVLHAATVHLTTTCDDLTLLLLADCLYCLQS